MHIPLIQPHSQLHIQAKLLPDSPSAPHDDSSISLGHVCFGNYLLHGHRTPRHCEGRLNFLVWHSNIDSHTPIKAESARLLFPAVLPKESHKLEKELIWGRFST
jgi:hypothetical protein